MTGNEGDTNPQTVVENSPADSQATAADGAESRPAIQWTVPARKQVEKLTPANCGGKDPVKYHEDHVREHARENAPDATRARIRRTAHPGGQDPTEPEHITVTYKAGNRALGTWHVYTADSDETL